MIVWHAEFVARLMALLDPQDLDILRLVARAAEVLGEPLYLVGGLPRDLLLGRTSHDLDLVVEGDAVALARRLAAEHGGSVTAHRRFGTATWRREPPPREGHGSAESPRPKISLDLITARSEIYPNPAQLPQVRPATIEDDLCRRDFSMNAIAIRLDGENFGHVLDPFERSRGHRTQVCEGIARRARSWTILHACIAPSAMSSVSIFTSAGKPGPFFEKLAVGLAPSLASACATSWT